MKKLLKQCSILSLLAFWGTSFVIAMEDDGAGRERSFYPHRDKKIESDPNSYDERLKLYHEKFVQCAAMQSDYERRFAEYSSEGARLLKRQDILNETQVVLASQQEELKNLRDTVDEAHIKLASQQRELMGLRHTLGDVLRPRG